MVGSLCNLFLGSGISPASDNDHHYQPVADPGFPIGGAPTHWGGANLQQVHFLAKMYAKMKEIGPVGGHALAAPPWIRQCQRIYKLGRAR